MENNIQNHEKEKLSRQTDNTEKFHVFNYLSRMHISSSTSFYTTLFVYLAYIASIANLHSKINDNCLLVKYHFNKITIFAILIGVPTIIFLYKLVKYQITNAAFERLSKEIKLENGISLYSYIWGQNGLHSGFIGNKWLKWTLMFDKDKKNWRFWFIGSIFLLSIFIFTIVFSILIFSSSKEAQKAEIIKSPSLEKPIKI